MQPYLSPGDIPTLHTFAPLRVLRVFAVYYRFFAFFAPSRFTIRPPHSRSRILFLVPDLLGSPGGIARACRTVCQALLDARARLDVVSLNDHARGRGRRRKAAKLFPGHKYLKYQSCGGVRPLFVVRSFLAALRLRPSIVLVGHANFSGLGWLLARLLRARLVVLLYGIEVWHTLPRGRRQALQRADLVIAISRYTARRAFLAQGLDGGRMRILHLCLDSAFLDAAIVTATATAAPPRLHVPHAEDEEGRPPLSLLTVARMSLHEQYKGHNYVIEAMPALLVEFPQLVYNIIGEGEARGMLEELAVREGVAHAVHFRGRVSEEELHRYYMEATLFIMPSSGEGFGLVFLEAMSHGAPVIAGNRDATPEVVRDGETGYLVDPTSVPEIVAAASRLLGDKELRDRLGQAAQRSVTEDFGYNDFRDKLVEYLLKDDMGR